MSEPPLLLVERHGAVARLTLNRPTRRNALSGRLLGELCAALRLARDDDAVRVVTITGSGGLFCGGGDLQQMASPDDQGPVASFPELLRALRDLGKPTVARVEGGAFGGGLGLMAACDFAIAADGARFGLPEIDLGLFPMMIMALLFRQAPRRRMLELMLTAEKFDAAEALRLGLVNRVVPAGELDAAVEARCATLSGKSPTAMRLGLRAFHEQDDMPFDQALEYLEGRLFECLGTEDAREGIAAFLQKRAPRWTGR